MSAFIKIAHRGSSGSYPEHTRRAFEKAIEAGADMIEMDCQLTKDGHVVVIHDERLERTAGVKGLVRGKTLKELKKLDFGSWFKKSFKGEKILTLEEVLEITADKIDLNVEIKPLPPGYFGIELKILFILSRYDYLERSLISSSDYRSLRRVRELAPDARIGILYGRGAKDFGREPPRDNPFQLAREIGAHSLHVQKECASRDLLERAKQAGLKRIVWTVNEVGEMDKFLSLGVDGIISDFPERFWKLKPRKR